MLGIITRNKKESLKAKRTLIFIGLTAAVCGGYILFLAIAAPQQLAEATTTAASNVVCNGCVGSSDIADNSILSADIGNGRIFSEDIRDGQVGSVDIGDRQVAARDIVDNAIKPLIALPPVSGKTIPEGETGFDTADCPAGTFVTGGGFQTTMGVGVFENYPADLNTWYVEGINGASSDQQLSAYVVCIGPMP
jgi:hypothetical protein